MSSSNMGHQNHCCKLERVAKISLCLTALHLRDDVEIILQLIDELVVHLYILLQKLTIQDEEFIRLAFIALLPGGQQGPGGPTKLPGQT